MQSVSLIQRHQVLLASGRAAIATCAAIVVLALGAFVFPRLVIEDHVPDDVPDVSLRMLKTEAARWHPLHRLFVLQVTDVHTTGPNPDNIDGNVAWRTLFGIPAGDSSHYAGSTHYDVLIGITLIVWIAFLATEAALSALLLWQLWPSP